MAIFGLLLQPWINGPKKFILFNLIIITYYLHFKPIKHLIHQTRDMEKYRRWTDQSTGINPFIVATKHPHNYLTKIASFVIITQLEIVGIIKIIIFLVFFPFYLFTLLLPMSIVSQFSTQIILCLLANYSVDDQHFINQLNKSKEEEGKIILSNHSSLIDIFYFIRKVPRIKFLIFHEDSDERITYSIASTFSMALKVLKTVQPFYHNNQTLKGSQSLEELISKTRVLKSNNLLIFHEKIRTNGLGTLKISRQLGEDLYKLERNVIVSQVKYTSSSQRIFCLTKRPLRLLFDILSCLMTGNNIRVRCTTVESSAVHSANEFRNNVNDFYAGNSLLETKANTFDSFIEVFQKTQKDEYIN